MLVMERSQTKSLPLRKKRVDFSDQLREIACRMHSIGLSNDQISFCLNVSRTSVDRVISQFTMQGKVPKRVIGGNKPLSPETTESVLATAKTMELPTATSIHRVVTETKDVSIASVRNILHKNKLRSKKVRKVCGQISPYSSDNRLTFLDSFGAIESECEEVVNELFIRNNRRKSRGSTLSG